MTPFPTFISPWPTPNPPLPQGMQPECAACERRGSAPHRGHIYGRDNNAYTPSIEIGRCKSVNERD
jgi:hypothetical protein